MFEAFVLAVALAMDATAVAAARAVSGIQRRELLTLAVSFGVFQAGMAAAGWLLGASAAKWVSAWDHWLAFALLMLIGAKMLYEAVRGDDDETGPVKSLGMRDVLVLSVATSIDALAAGVTLPTLGAAPALSLVMIGVTSLVLSALGGVMGTRFGSHVGSKLEIVGGLALMGIGVKTLVEHLSV